MHFIFYSHRRHKMSLETTGYGMDHSEDQTDGYMRDYANRRPSDTTRYAFLQINKKIKRFEKYMITVDCKIHCRI